MSEAVIRHRLETQHDRVREHSSQLVNQRITRAIQANLERCVREGRDAIVTRLAELDREWDIDRILMANFAIAGGAAYALGLERFSSAPLLGKPKTGLLYMLGAQFGFLLMHAAIGWCPPAAIWRRFGARTKAEIEVERTVLLDALAADTSREAARHQQAANPKPPPQQQISS